MALKIRPFIDKRLKNCSRKLYIITYYFTLITIMKLMYVLVVWAVFDSLIMFHDCFNFYLTISSELIFGHVDLYRLLVF